MTGYEAANLALTRLGYGDSTHADIIPVEEDEAHIRIARAVKKSSDAVVERLNPFSDFFMV